MDEIARFNKERWEALAAANIEYSRPMLNLTLDSARELVDAQGILGPVAGKRVLCLASGGGQQSAAFGLLGAQVAVLDLAETQLERDRIAAAHYGLTIQTLQGDMRDLSRFADGSLDVVWHAHSINFIPDPQTVFAEVARVLRPGGLYHVSCHNPLVHGIDERDWDSHGYHLSRPYVDGAEILSADPHWDVWQTDGTVLRVRGPHEYRHTFGGLINGMIRHGLTLLGLWEDAPGAANSPEAQPGTWAHFTTIAPPYFTMWAQRK